MCIQSISLLFYVIYLQNANLHNRGKACLVFFSVPKVKILTMLSYYTTFGIVQLVNVTITINDTTPFQNELFRYFECELTGYDPICEDIRGQFEEYIKPELNGLSYSLFAFITWVNLLFAINRTDVKWLTHKVMSIDCRSTIA